MIDITKTLKNIVPEQDGPSDVNRRKMVVAAINGDDTVDLISSGVTVPSVPVLAGAFLTVGSNVQVITERGAMLVLGKVGAAIDPTPVAAFPSAYVTLSATLANGVVTDFTPATVPYNIGAMYPGSGTTFTVPTGQGGLYQAGIVLRYASQASPAGTRQARVNKNGAEFMLFNQPAVTNYASSNIVVNGGIRLPLVAGDTISFAGFQNSGGSLALVGNSVAWLDRIR